jgi:hypothetical protein
MHVLLPWSFQNRDGTLGKAATGSLLERKAPRLKNSQEPPPGQRMGNKPQISRLICKKWADRHVQGCGGAIMLLEIPFEIVSALCEFLRELILDVLYQSLVELTKDFREAF